LGAIILKKALIISFDLIRGGESETSLSIGTLLAYLKNDFRYGVTFEVEHKHFNLLSNKNINLDVLQLDFSTFSFIAISCYVWSDYLTNNIINELRQRGFKGIIALGGYQITYGNNEELRKNYPDCQVFISGYAELALLEVILTDKNQLSFPLFLKKDTDFKTIPSAYLSGDISIINNQKMVRFETKRGCPYACSFCAHRDLSAGKSEKRVHKFGLEKVFEEISFFNARQVAKINILDPVFNMGEEYLSVLQEFVKVGFKGQIAIQTRFENIKGKQGELFLDLCAQLNVVLEFGLQTINEAEYNVINRKNKMPQIRETMFMLAAQKIKYEISLMYGLPNQTVDSFKKSIDFVQSNGCDFLTAFPLMLLRGTELYAEKNKWNLKEKILGDFHIPTVVSGNSFSENDWLQMNHIADKLMKNTRIA